MLCRNFDNREEKSIFLSKTYPYFFAENTAGEKLGLSYAGKMRNIPVIAKRKTRIFAFKQFTFCIVSWYNTDMRIWAKLMTDGRIRKQYVYENPEKLTYSHFFDYLTEICHELDIPTPVLTKTHIFNFAKFNHVKFIGRDFVESLGYDHLFLENLL